MTVLFIYMAACKEALLTSQFKNTQSPFSALMLFERHIKLNTSLEDLENY